MADTEHPLPIARIIRALEEQHPWLFERDRFEIVYSSLSGRYDSEPTVGLSNGRIQLLFFDEQALPLVAWPGAQWVNLYDESPEREQYLHKVWLDPMGLFNFIDQQPPLYTYRRLSELIEPTWRKLEARLPELEQRFASEATMRRWVPAFMRWLGGGR